jgi:hypothetical protein
MMEWLRELSAFAAVLPTLRLWLASSISCFTTSTSLTVCSCRRRNTQQDTSYDFKGASRVIHGVADTSHLL